MTETVAVTDKRQFNLTSVITLAINIGVLVWGAATISNTVASMERTMAQMAARQDRLQERQNVQDVEQALLRYRLGELEKSRNSNK